MPIIKIKVSRGLEAGDFQKIVDDFFSSSIPTIVLSQGWIPKVDMYETDRALFVVADLAGVDKESLLVTVDGQHLRISGQRHPPTRTGGRRFHQLEIEYGPFVRVLRLPEGVDIDNVEAQYEHGVLTVQMPRSSDKSGIKVEVK